MAIQGCLKKGMEQQSIIVGMPEKMLGNGFKAVVLIKTEGVVFKLQGMGL